MAAGFGVELTAPNGRRYVQPTGLFIDNEWVGGSGGEMITSVNPSYVLLFFSFFLPCAVLMVYSMHPRGDVFDEEGFGFGRVLRWYVGGGDCLKATANDFPSTTLIFMSFVFLFLSQSILSFQRESNDLS